MSPIMVAISVQNDGQAVEIVLAAEHRTWLHTIFDVPNDESIAKQVLASTVHFELYLKLPVSRLARLK